MSSIRLCSTAAFGVALLAVSASAVADEAPNPPSPATPAPTLLAMPFVGVHSYRSGVMASYYPGPRIGAVLGARLAPWFSLNAEATYDRSFFRLLVESQPPSEGFADFALSPFFHVPRGNVELLFGPEVGFFVRSLADQGMTGPYTSWSAGLVLGLNAGGFVRVTDYASLGGMLTFERRMDRRYCQTLGTQPEVCTSNDVIDSAVVMRDANLVALTVAALF
jgi:hypothetical protein